MPVTDIGKFMFMPEQRNSVHKAMLDSDPRVERVVVLDHKTYTMLPPGSIQVFLYIRWLESDTHEVRKAFWTVMSAKLLLAAGIGVTSTLSFVEVFE